ncbi:MAG: hypothetical protein ACRC7G_14100 [Beijerinckiaceae bacterium]
MKTDHFLSLCDDTGLFQHAIHAIADRAHGYCIDDNARALLVTIGMNDDGEQPLPDILTARFCAFIQHGWNKDRGRFRNFMDFKRSWLEEAGSEDSHGRTLWALGVCALAERRPSHRAWAARLFAEALPAVEWFRSPRAWAFTLLGLDAYCKAAPADPAASRMRGKLAAKLMHILSVVRTADWVWFEEGLAYDNARLPEALLATGLATEDAAMTTAGLQTLAWLTMMQGDASGGFRPVGSDSFGGLRQQPKPFDQQPLEAAATIAACLAAFRADGSVLWAERAGRAFDWFHGANDLGVPLVDPVDGGCRDGLHPDRANENRGAESAVSYLLACLDMRRLAALRNSQFPECGTDASRTAVIRLRA